MKRRYKNICRLLHRIHLIDKCLIIFMILLLAQSACDLFFYKEHTQDMDNIDAIMRTAAASIFGYFLSANFVKRNTNQTDDAGADGAQGAPLAAAHTTGTDAPQGRIGFTADDGAASAGAMRGQGSYGGKWRQLDPAEYTNRVQIIIATSIGVFSLCVLLYMRNFSAIRPNTLNTLAQLHNFVSGCVGFLIGCPTNTVDDGAAG